MTPDHNQDNLMAHISKALQQDSDGMRAMVEILLNVLMKAERGDAIGATPYERTEERMGYANGFKPKAYSTRLGKLNLNIPQVRGMEFYPKCLEKGCRSERALKAAVAEMYIKGVSTRNVKAVTEELCGLEISSTQVSRATKELDEELEKFRNRPLGEIAYLFFDATYFKVRHNQTVLDVACLIAYGVDADGKRQIVGVSTSLSEAEVHWRSFFTGLVERGLHGLRLITSDDHPGMKKARMAVFPSVPWQRCQFHLSQNAQSYSPTKAMRGEIARVMRTIFNSPSLEDAREQMRRAVKKYEQQAPEFCQWLEANVEEGLVIYQFPDCHWKRIRTTNGLERINREIKRRVRVAVLFPNPASALRLVTALLAEVHEEWICGRTYLDMPSLGQKEKVR